MVAGKPLVDQLIERMNLLSPDELRIVTRPEKSDLIAHAERLGAKVILGHPEEVAASLRLGLEGLADDDEVLLGFPDSLWKPKDGFVAVLELLRAGSAIALGLFHLTEGLERSDVVRLDRDGRVVGVQVKPEHPASDLIWGIAATHAAVLRDLPADADPGAYFDSLAQHGTVKGVVISNSWLDVGTPEALEQARRTWPAAAAPDATG